MWQNRQERPNRSTYNGDKAEKAKRPVSELWSESMSFMLLERS